MRGSSGNNPPGLTRGYAIEYGGDASGNHGRQVSAAVAREVVAPFLASRNPLPEAPTVERDLGMHHDNV